MTVLGPLSFEDWVRHCFSSTTPDWYWQDDAPEYHAAPAEVAGYLAWLCREALRHLADYADNQLTIGLWYVFGVASCFVDQAGNAGIQKKHDLCQAVPSLYADFLATRCSNTGELETDLDTAVYMMWDMGQLTVIPQAELLGGFDVSLTALETILFDTRNTTCQLSALHALFDHRSRIPDDRYRAIVERVVSHPDIHSTIRAAARAALDGKHP